MKTLAYLVLALCLVGCAATTSKNVTPSRGIETCVEWEVEKCPKDRPVKASAPPEQKEEREAYKFSWEEFLKTMVDLIPPYIP